MLPDRRSRLPRFAGLALFGFGTICLINAVPQADLLWNSLVVVAGSVAIGSVIGGFAGWLVGWTDIPGRHWWLTLLLTWAMTPLVVQVAAWDSLWGRLSWLAVLNDVTYARWFEGLAAVLWVQGLASVPWFALLVVAVRHTVSATCEEEAQLQWSLQKVFILVSLPRHRIMFLLIGLVVGLRTFEQIEVSDVYQIRTWPEVWYLGFALGTFEGWGAGEGTGLWKFLFGTELSFQAWGTTREAPSAALGTYQTWQLGVGILASSIGLGLLLVHGLRQWFRVLPNWDWQPVRRLAALRQSGWNLYLLAAIAIPQVVIWSNLMVRSGLGISQSDTGLARGWSWQMLTQRLSAAMTDYRDPMIWSWLIGFVAAVLVSFLSVAIAWIAYRRNRMTLVVFMVAAFSLMVPAPLVSLLWYRVLNLSPWNWLDVLAQTSILGPVLAIGLKNLGMALLYWLVIFRQQPSAWREEMQLNGVGLFPQFWHLAIRVPWLPHLSLLLILTMMGAGDLSASFATLPPGLDTLPRRMLGDLHSGASGNVAAACLMQIGLVLIGSTLISYSLKTKS